MEEPIVPEGMPEAPESQADGGARRRRRMAIILSLGLLVVVGAFAFHLLARRPLTTAVPVPIPALSDAARAPKFDKNIEVMSSARTAQPDTDPDGKPTITTHPLMSPRGVTVSLDGSRILVADTEAVVVSVFDRNGKPLFSLSGTGEGKLQLPVMAASSPDGRIFVVDRIQNRVAIYTSNGDFLSNFWPENMPTTFKMSPLAINFDKRGNMYLGDGEGAAYVFDSEGKLKLRLVPPEGNIMGAFGIAVNSAGTIAVTDTNRGRVLLFKPNGDVDRILDGFGLPRGVAIDEDGNVFVVDTLGHQVQMYDARGKLVHSFGDWGALDGQLNFPDAVAVDGAGRVFVADRGNHRTQVWTY